MHHASHKLNIKTILFFLSSLFLTSTCLQAQYYYKGNNATSTKVEVGDAVYYADYLHGRTTALGEIYRMEAMTCAHRNHPKGTLLKVSRLDNGQSVVVRVNDRGPYSQGTVVDISRAAAAKIGLLRDGRARVTVESVGFSETNPGEKAAKQQQQPSSYSQVQPRQSGSVYYPAPQQKYPSQSQTTAKGGYYNTQNNQTPNSYNNTNTRRLDTNASQGSTSTKASINRLAPGVKGYAIQLSSFKNIDNANRQVLAVQQKGIKDVYLMQKGGLNKVVIAVFPNQFAAQQYLDRLRQQFLMDGIVIMLR